MPLKESHLLLFLAQLYFVYSKRIAYVILRALAKAGNNRECNIKKCKGWS